MFSWLIVLVAYPFLIDTIQLLVGNINPSFYLTTLGNKLISLFVLFVAFYLIYFYGVSLIKTIIYFSSALIIIAFIWNLIHPGFFHNLFRVLESPESSDYSMLRLAGFFLNSNRAALVTICLLPFFLVLSKFSKNKSLTHSMHIAMISFFIVLTGSRTGIFMTIMYIVMVSYFVKDIFNNVIYWLGIPLLILLFSATMFLTNASGFLYRLGLDQIASRVEFFQNVNQFEEDKSVSSRLAAQKQYIKKIIENPIIGYGSEKAKELKIKKKFVKSSHNAFIENTFKFGVPYLFIVLIAFMLTFSLFWKAKAYNEYWILIFILFAYSFSVNGVLGLLSINAFLGLSIGLVYKENRLISF